MSEKAINDDKTPPFLISVRCLLAVMAFFGYCLQYMLKINLGIAIVCMVNNTALEHTIFQNYSNNETYLNQFPDNFTSHKGCLFESKHSSKLDGQFIWPKSTQGLLLASYFYGYIITQVPGGWLSAKYGGRNVLGISNIIASILTIIIPFCARWHYIALIICRLLIGLAHGIFWPAMSSVFVYWAPAKERAKILGTSTSGAWVGNIIALPLAGYLCVNGFDGGWPSIFYIFGVLGFVWSVMFMILVRDSPKTHHFISTEEREYLIRETKKEVAAKEMGPMKTPWKEIFLSKVCIATFVAHFCNNWGNYLYLTQLPSFMKDVLKFDIKSNGLMSAIPYIACASVTAGLGLVSDPILRMNLLSRHNLRRVFNGIGLSVAAVFVISLSFVNCSMPYLGVAFLTLGLASNGFYWSAGPLVNINDIAGVHSGVVFGITNTFGTIPGIVCPYIVGVLTKNRTQREWQNVFIICACVYSVGAVYYWIFSESKLQPWAVVENKRSDTSNQEKNINENKTEYDDTESLELKTRF